MKKAIILITILSSWTLALAEPMLYFADSSGAQISTLNAVVGSDITIYIYGRTGIENTYDYFNFSLAYDPAAITPKTGIASQDLVMSTAGTFGPSFGHQETTFNGTSLISAAAASMGGFPAGFDTTLLATVYFTLLDQNAEVSFFNEENEYTYSMFFLDTTDMSEVRFSSTLTIVPEPATLSLFAIAALYFIRKRGSNQA